MWRRANSRRVSRTTSLYLLVFGVVWAPSLLVRVQVLVLGPARAPSFPLAALEALCMPLQGECVPPRSPNHATANHSSPTHSCATHASATRRRQHALQKGRSAMRCPLSSPHAGALNAAVYGWSLPRIRDMYRTMLLGIDSLDAASILRPNSAAIRPSGTPTSEYSPPTSRALSEHSSGAKHATGARGQGGRGRHVQPKHGLHPRAGQVPFRGGGKVLVGGGSLLPEFDELHETTHTLSLPHYPAGKTTPDWNGQRDPSPSRQELLRAA